MIDYQELVERYRAARRIWRDTPGLAELAAEINMSEREYCHRYISSLVVRLYVVGTGTSTTTISTAFIEQTRAWASFADAAFEEAGE